MSNSITYQYTSSSGLRKEKSREALHLAKYSEIEKSEAPCFFWGRLTEPYITARCLITLSNIVKSSFSMSPFQLALLKDPIVTAGNEKIRFEGFSHCAGVYARVDVLPDGHDGEFLESGTTNVDFNQPMINALGGLKKGAPVVLSVGEKEVGLHQDGDKVTERKVPLPTKWIKGLNTVQFFLADSEPACTFNRVQALQLFKTLPSAKTKTDYYLTVRGNRPVVSPVPSQNGVCIGGIHRLQLLKPLIPHIDQIQVFRHKDQQSNTWQLYFGPVRFTFSLSRDSWRGFSGEGAGLEALIEDTPESLIRQFNHFSYANQAFNPTLQALEWGIDVQKVDNLAGRLSAMGLLGYDLDENGFFYRRLPFKMNRILSLNPRMKAAEKLLAEDKVAIIHHSPEKTEARVAGTGVFHTVLLEGDQSRCTCKWFSKHQGERGLCKHQLAVRKKIAEQMERDIQNTFAQILKKQDVDRIFSFLESLSANERKELIPALKEIARNMFQIIQQGDSWIPSFSEDQIRIIRLACYVCFNQKDFEQRGHFISQEDAKRIMPFYIPKWFNNYVNTENTMIAWRLFDMDYPWMMELKSQGILQPMPHLITRMLLPFPFLKKKHPRGQLWKFVEERLYQYPEILEEHIWLFFANESFIHQQSYFINDQLTEEVSWKDIFVLLCEKQKIDRFRVLRESLDTSYKNFTKVLTGWFASLFEALDPTKKELLALQKSLLSTFSCPHSKPVTTSLKYLKKICTSDQFVVDDFLEQVPLLLTMDSKTIVRDTLMILERLAKKHTGKRSQICQLATQAFLNHDPDLQTRAAKIALSYGERNDHELMEAINQYADLLSTEPRSLLTEFLVATESENTLELNTLDLKEETAVLAAENQIELPLNVDDLVFFASQAFDNHDQLHFDLLPDALIRLNAQIKEENLSKFAPALQQAYQVITGGGAARQGRLDHLLGAFFREYVYILCHRLPGGAQELLKIKRDFLKKERDRPFAIFDKTLEVKPFQRWAEPTDSPIYRPFVQKLAGVLKQLREQNFLPILSTPTHNPFWIDPAILIERVKLWQDSNHPINQMDFQLALSRTYLNGEKLVQARIDQDLKKEQARILSFLLTPEASPRGPFEDVASWWTAAITKSPETVYPEFKNFIYAQKPQGAYAGDYPWSVKVMTVQNSRYDVQKRRMVTVDDQVKMMKIAPAPVAPERSFWSNFFQKLLKPILEDHKMLYDELELKSQWYFNFENDIQRFYGLVPNNPEKLLAAVNAIVLAHPTFNGKGEQNSYNRLAEQLLQHVLPFGKMGHLFIAGGMICSDKTARTLAAELWIHAVSYNLIESQQIGNDLGQHLNIEFSPMKRLTDLLTESLFNISQKHNKALQLLIEELLLGLESPIRGLKRFLEIYLDVLTQNQRGAAPQVLHHITPWQSSASLKKVIDLIGLESSS